MVQTLTFWRNKFDTMTNPHIKTLYFVRLLIKSDVNKPVPILLVIRIMLFNIEFYIVRWVIMGNHCNVLESKNPSFSLIGIL